MSRRKSVRSQAKIGLVGAATLLCAGIPTASQGQSGQGATPLPPVSVDITRPKRKPRRAATAPRREPAAAPVQPAVAPSTASTQAGRSGTAGYLTSRTSTGTRTNTPIINIPQSISVVTQEFLRDQNNQSFLETLRYVPGVVPHQGEGNRDDVVIRGQRSNADFFVDGIRDDVQYFRDVYNVQRVEVLKGPNAMIFGRGGGGGIINRVRKEADGSRVREVTIGAGQFDLGRVAVDFADAINPNVAARFNAVYENAGSYRDFGHLERYGINPAVAFRPNDQTTIALSYEYFHDRRVTDRGIPSQSRAGVTPGPATPLFPYLTAPSTFFGNPNLNYALVDAHIGTAVIEHDFDNGLKVKNQTRLASYDKFYQNIFPGGAVNAAGTSVNLSAYNNENDRRNVFNQTDVTYKLETGWIRHTLLAGVELGEQNGLSFRQTGLFNGVSRSLAVSPLSPTTYVPVTFRNLDSDASNTYRLGLGAVYLQDQIEITRYFQLIGGLRFDHFDLTSTDRRNGASFNRVDQLVSPRVGAVVKPVENVAFYGSYSVSYLPSAGDQFSTLAPGTAIAEPEKFENRELGVKWDIVPRLQLSAAIYGLDRTNQRFPDPNNPGFFILSGKTNTKGFEIGLTGYVTDQWQVSGGYAYTDARIVGATSATVVPGNRVGLVPYHALTLWNKYEFVDWFAIGAGVIHQTDSFAASDDTVLLPGWTRVDAGIFGRYRMWDGTLLSWQVNVENVFNTAYYATADGNNNITPGSPRAIRGVLRANF